MTPNKGGSSPQNRNLPDTSRKRPTNSPLTPPFQNKNKYSPLQNINDETDQDATISDNTAQNEQVSPKIPPIYVYNITNYKTFHDSLSNQTLDDFSITHTKNALKLNLTSIDDYRTITKCLDESETEYHTYQLYSKKQLSVIIRNLPVSIPEEMIYSALKDQKFEIESVTRLQNRFKSPIPIVAVLLSKSSTEIYSLNRLLHCVVIVEPRKPSNGIPQCTNCQRFSHTKKFCHLPPRCVKCAGDHHYSQCQKTIEVPPKCVNCESNHPASYRGCTFYKEISKSKHKNKNSTNDKNNSNMAFKPINENIHININKDKTGKHYTYASACNNNKNNYENKSTNNTNKDSDFMKTLLPLINTFVSQLMQKIIENLPVIINSLNLSTNGSP